MRRFRAAGSVAAAVVTAAVLMGPGPVGAVPDQASDTGEAHAHSHGPDGLELDRRGQVVAAPFTVDDKAPWSAGEHDGVAFSADQPDRYFNLPQVHAVYVFPSDKASRFAQFAAMFQADARQASKLLTDNYGYGVRFDERAGGYLDITVIKSQYKYRQLSGANQFSLVSNELKSRLPDATKKYTAWLDAGSKYCGQGNLYQDTQRNQFNANDANRTTAIVYRPYSAGDPTTGGFCRGRTLLHEVGHNLGAIQRVAPHAFDGAHCDDDDNDVMCYTSAATFVSPGLGKFDYNNDDYWDARADANESLPPAGKLGWWAVNLSKFICPPVAGAPDCTQPNTILPTDY